MDGDVDGAYPQVHDALKLPLRQVGEGDIIAQQEGKAGVVVLKVKGFTHTRRHLVHKTGMNCQIVACPGVNDGPVLTQSLKDLSELFPAVESVAVVPAMAQGEGVPSSSRPSRAVSA